jgi:hypothetical protein
LLRSIKMIPLLVLLLFASLLANVEAGIFIKAKQPNILQGFYLKRCILCNKQIIINKFIRCGVAVF